MTIQFACPSCNKQLKISNPALAGKKLKCPKCAATITAPASAEDEIEPSPPPVPKKTAPSKPPEPRLLEEADEKPRMPPPPPPRKPVRSDDEDEQDDAPPPPSRRRPAPQPVAARPGLAVPIMVAVVSLLYLGAIVAVFLGLANTLLLGDVTVRKAKFGANNLEQNDGADVKKLAGVQNPRAAFGNLPRIDPAELALREEEWQARLAVVYLEGMPKLRDLDLD